MGSVLRSLLGLGQFPPSLRCRSFLGVPRGRSPEGFRRWRETAGYRSAVCSVRDHVLETRSVPCYPFLVLDLPNFLTCFLIRPWPLRVNKCRMASSVVMSFGCFLFFAIGAL